jgi:integrase
MDWPPKLPRDFPLTVTARGYVKRIAGRLKWIAGKVPPDDALAIYHRKAAALVSGHEPMPEPERFDGGMTVHEMLARWLLDRHRDATRGELTAGAFVQYKLSAKRIDGVIGHLPTDVVNPDMTRALYDRLAKQHGVDFAKRAIGHLRTAARHAADSDWVRPIRLGDKVVAKLASRPQARMKWKLYAPADIVKMLDALDAIIAKGDGRTRPSWCQMKAMILLALNGGYGARELGELPREVVDLAGRRIDYRRGKTKAGHVVPLWDETVEALKIVLEYRPGDDLVFRTREGHPWSRTTPIMKNGRIDKVMPIDNVNERFRQLVDKLGMRFEGQGFYKLKHLHATLADRAGDPHATFALAGHALPGAKSHYVDVGEDRVRKVVEYVRHVLLIQPRENRKTASDASDAARHP